MKIVEINAYNYGSTGTIMKLISNEARRQGHEVTMCYPKRRCSINGYEKGDIWIGNIFVRNINLIISYYLPIARYLHIITTFFFLQKLKKIKPDIIHLHNLHSTYLNLPMLFNYIKKNNIKTVWTLHDCWAFTGHCPYYDIKSCEKWKTGCYDCPSYKEYPYSAFDDSKYMYSLKKKIYSKIPYLSLVTPSMWLCEQVKMSFLRKQETNVIYNGIDLEIFKPIESLFRKKNGCENKTILLGVANVWDNRKGLDIFIELEKLLDKNKYQIVLVGTDRNVDSLLPKSIISIHRTQSKQELAKIYTAADIFINPTREEVFGLVNIESLACGTPVITFASGGSPECVINGGGIVVEEKTSAGIIQAINKMGKNMPNSSICIESSKNYGRNKMASEYVRLFEKYFDNYKV